MTITNSAGGTTITGKDIDRFAVLQLRSVLKLEIKGIRMWRGVTAFATAKKKFGFKGNKHQVLEQLDAYIAAQIEPAMNSELPIHSPQEVAAAVAWNLIGDKSGEPLSTTPKALCPECGAWAIVELTPAQRLSQPDDTTHACHKGLGGCGTGFTDSRTREPGIHGVCPKCGGAQLEEKGCTNEECPLVGTFA